MAYQKWLDALWDVLQSDDAACVHLIRASGGHLGCVPLVHGDVTAEEALAFARTLSEMGQLGAAMDVLTDVVRTAFGMQPLAYALAVLPRPGQR